MSGAIHATAVIDPSAELGSGVRVGPFAIIEAGCKIGDGCAIAGHAVICAGSVLGPGNEVGYGAVIGANPQDLSFKESGSRVEIGARNRIREYATIHRATAAGGATRVGDDNFLMGGVHLGHDVQVGNRVIMANNVLLAGHVLVEDGVFLGGATVVHQWVRIGRLAITRGGARLGKDVPPFCMAVETNAVSGINRVGLQRAGVAPETRRAIRAAYDLIFRSGLNVSQALVEVRAKLAEPEVEAMAAFVAASKRGICRDRGRGGEESDGGE